MLGDGHGTKQGSGSCLTGAVQMDDVQLRLMREDDGAAVFALCLAVLFDPIPGGEELAALAHFTRRADHLLTTDPGGTWVAERDGEVVGVSMALVREGVWGLSLFAVAADLHGKGIGRQLLDATLRFGEDRGADGWIIMSSSNPAAMRRYLAAGFDLHPAVGAAGVPDLRRAPAAAEGVGDAGAAGIATADAIWRDVRGAGMGVDIEVMLAGGARLLLVEDRAAVVARDQHVSALAARDEEAASLALWAALCTAPSGATVNVDCITGAQPWAIRVCQDARLDLTPDGPLLTRGRVGPLAPYLPSGAYL